MFFRGTTLVDSYAHLMRLQQHSRCPEITVRGTVSACRRPHREVGSDRLSDRTSQPRVLLSGRSAGRTGLRHRVSQIIQFNLYHYDIGVIDLSNREYGTGFPPGLNIRDAPVNRFHSRLLQGPVDSGEGATAEESPFGGQRGRMGRFDDVMSAGIDPFFLLFSVVSPQHEYHSPGFSFTFWMIASVRVSHPLFLWELGS